jgi:hypothetical protein
LASLERTRVTFVTAGVGLLEEVGEAPPEPPELQPTISPLQATHVIESKICGAARLMIAVIGVDAAESHFMQKSI